MDKEVGVFGAIGQFVKNTFLALSNVASASEKASRVLDLQAEIFLEESLLDLGHKRAERLAALQQPPANP